MPYINTIDINGEVYNLGNLTDGYYTVDLPTLEKDDVFVLQGNVVNNLTSSQQNKPLSANQGRVLNEKINAEVQNSINRDNIITENLNAEISRATTKDSELDEKIDAETTRATSAENELTTELNNEVLRATTKEDELNTKIETETTRATTAENTLTTNLGNEVSRATAKETELDTKISNLQTAVNTKDTELDGKITQLRTDMDDNDSSTLSSAKTYTDTECATTLSSAESYTNGRYTDEEKAKLNGIEAEANKYVHPSYAEQPSGLYNITVDTTGHVYSVTAVTKADIVALGIPAQDTVYTLPKASSTEIGGVKIDSDYVLGAEDVAASTAALNSAYETLALKISNLSSKYDALLKRIEALEKQNTEATV